MRRFLDNIESQLSGRSHSAYLIYYNPTCRNVIANYGTWKSIIREGHTWLNVLQESYKFILQFEVFEHQSSVRS